MKFSAVAVSLFFAAAAYAQSESGAASETPEVSGSAAPEVSGSAAVSGSGSAAISGSASSSGSGAAPEPTEDGAAFQLAAPMTLGAVAVVAGLLL